MEPCESSVILLSILVLLIWFYLLIFHAGFWRLRQFYLPPNVSRTNALVVAIVPARNEAEFIGRAVSSLLKQEFTGELRLFVIDDNSTDGTANAARAAAAMQGASDRLTVIAGSALPPGWTGKVWAMHQGWQTARTANPDYLLLTDADIEHAPDTLSRLIAQAECGPYDLTSVMVKLRCANIPEKLLIPAFVYFFFLLYPPARILDPKSKTAGAAGGCILLRPEALEGAAGLEAIRGEIIDDCKLAACIKRSGGSLWLGVTEQSRSMRGYESLAGLRNMIARTAFNQLRHSWLLLAGCLVGMLLTFVTPLVLVWSQNKVTGWIALATCILMFTTYIPVLRLYRINSLAIVTLPFAALFYMYATLCSALNYLRGRGGSWKGRAQDVGAGSLH